MNTATGPNVVQFRERRESKRPPQISVEVENDPAVLWYLVHLRVEAVTQIWQDPALAPTIPGRSPQHLRIALALAQWKHDNQCWLPTLATIKSSRPGAEWRMPALQSYARIESLSVAVAGCLFWHALQEQPTTTASRSDIGDALLGWRTWIFLTWRRAAERVLQKSRVDPRRVILRSTALFNAEDDPNPDECCGFVLQAWPLAQECLAFVDGMERVRARIGLGTWTGDVPDVQRHLLIAYARHAG